MIQYESKLFVNGEEVKGVVSIDFSTQSDYTERTNLNLHSSYEGTLQVEISEEFKTWIEQNKLLNRIEYQHYRFWKKHGLTDEQIEISNVMEVEEFSQLHPYQEWSSRQSLLEKNIITLEKVLADINATT